MTIQEFWNQAFLANMHRLSPEKAKLAADAALEICIQHWHSKCYEWSPAPQLWQEQHVGYVNMPADIRSENINSDVFIKPFPDRGSVKIKSS